MEPEIFLYWTLRHILAANGDISCLDFLVQDFEDNFDH